MSNISFTLYDTYNLKEKKEKSKYLLSFFIDFSLVNNLKYILDSIENIDCDIAIFIHKNNIQKLNISFLKSQKKIIYIYLFDINCKNSDFFVCLVPLLFVNKNKDYNNNIIGNLNYSLINSINNDLIKNLENTNAKYFFYSDSFSDKSFIPKSLTLPINPKLIILKKQFPDYLIDYFIDYSNSYLINNKLYSNINKNTLFYYDFFLNNILFQYYRLFSDNVLIYVDLLPEKLALEFPLFIKPNFFYKKNKLNIFSKKKLISSFINLSNHIKSNLFKNNLIFKDYIINYSEFLKYINLSSMYLEINIPIEAIDKNILKLSYNNLHKFLNIKEKKIDYGLFLDYNGYEKQRFLSCSHIQYIQSYGEDSSNNFIKYNPTDLSENGNKVKFLINKVLETKNIFIKYVKDSGIIDYDIYLEKYNRHLSSSLKGIYDWIHTTKGKRVIFFGINYVLTQIATPFAPQFLYHSEDFDFFWKDVDKSISRDKINISVSEFIKTYYSIYKNTNKNYLPFSYFKDISSKDLAEYWFGGIKRFNMLKTLFNYIIEKNIDIYFLSSNWTVYTSPKLIKQLLQTLIPKNKFELHYIGKEINWNKYVKFIMLGFSPLCKLPIYNIKDYLINKSSNNFTKKNIIIKNITRKNKKPK